MKRTALLLCVLFFMFFISAYSQTVDSRFLWEIYDQYKISPANPALLRHTNMVNILKNLQTESADLINIRQVGQSVEKRSINLISVGTGQTKVLLWSQMHGNEPTATCALLDILNYLQKNKEQQFIKDILSRSTILMIPMLNPDGAERFTRKNAQDIDINRDARYLQTPEGRTLKAVRDEYKPDFGFNLHDQEVRTSVGKTKKVASISLLAPPFDYEDNDNETKIRAKKVAVTFYQAVAPYMYGQVSRYDADYMPRSFGDMMQSWGVSTVLVESGGWTTYDRSILVKVNFTGLLMTISAIAAGSFEEANPLVYDALRRSGDQNLFDLLITGTTVVNGLGITPFTADIGINYSFSQTESGPLITGASIADLGDMGESDGKQVIDGSKLVCIPGFIIYNNEMTPDKIPDFESCRRLLRSGVTTVIGTVSLHQPDEIEQISHLFERNTNAVNLGFIGSTMLFSRELSEKERDNLLYGIAQRMLGIDTSGLPESAKKYIEWFSIRTVSGIKQKVSLPVEQIAIADVPEVTYQMARQVGLTNRGVIRTGSVADLLLFEQDSIEKQMGMLDLKKLRYILLNGVMVYENGVFTNEFKGSILRR